MFLNKFWLFLLSLVLCAAAEAAPRTLALLLGDVESRPAVLALRALQPTLKALDVSVRLIPFSGMTPAERSALGSADVVVLNARAGQLIQSIKPQLQSLQRASHPVLVVGGVLDDEQRALGLREDPLLQKYHAAGGVENMGNLLRHVLRTRFGADLTAGPVQPMPDIGLYDVAGHRTSASFDQYQRAYARYKPGAPWVGVMFYRASLVAGQTLPLAAIVLRLERAGYNVAPAFGYPYEVPLGYFLDENGQSRIELLVALGMKVGGNAATGGLLDKIGVPAINAITLSAQTAAQWQASSIGLDLIERTWQLAGAELAGLIQPTVVASRERVTDAQTGLVYVEERPIAERIERLTARIDAWMVLRRSRNADKRIVMLYYNYPHGSETIGAAYLNVLPESLWQMAQRLKLEGYRIDDAATSFPADRRSLQGEIQRWGNYPAKGGPEYVQALGRLAGSGQALLVPLADYRRWYDKLAPGLRGTIEKSWGTPEQSSVLWRDANGSAQFVFPARRYGNLVMAPQPGRAWEQHLEKLHNDVTLPPSHEYIAFYLWIQHGYQANAVLHVGTHGTQEWLSGKEVGLSEADPTEALIGALPNIYPYVMDDVGEGLQAKRRGMATIIDHMTPPFDTAGLNPDLRELGALLNDYRVAQQKSPLLAQSHLTALNRLALTSGVLKDMGRKAMASEADMEALEEYLDDTAGRLAPFGLHTFGVAPDAAMRNATARAVVGVDAASATPTQQASRIARLERDIERSAELELERLMQALAGRYIPSGPSADLVRNPDALPTGRNFFGLDPSRIPSRTTYEQGARLAQQLASDYRARHGSYPDKLSINLWGVETSRHEGIMESQALALMGIRPTWDERGRVTGVEAIARSQLGRPRVDVTMISSGLFRDLFGNLLQLLDQAALLAQQQDDSDNVLAAHTRKVADGLRQRGIGAAEAQRLASVRIFGLPTGAYGTQIEKLIPLSNIWQNEQQVADVFINRMSHPFGQGYWGEDLASESDAPLRHALFRQALSGSKIALHSRSSNLFATLDNDDFFQYLGGTALAIRSVDGKTPEVMVSDLSNPRRPRQTSLEKYMGQELQTRYLNPRWADSMLKEGYAGARFINRVVDYLWAWQVTVPEAVDSGKWQRMYDTYIADRHGLKVRERFADSGNLRAYQAITDRMLSAIERGYWQPSDAVRADLRQKNVQAIGEAGIACSTDSCSRATLQQAPNLLAQAPAGGRSAVVAATTSATAHPVAAGKSTPSKPPAAAAAPAKSAAPSAQVSGFEMQALSTLTPAEKTIGTLALLALAISLIGIGYWRRRRRW